MTKVTVTGGAGFIGSHAVDAYLAAGCEVRVFDNLATGSLDNLAHVSDQVNVIEGDLRDLDALQSACTAADVVLHLGALGSVPRSVADPRTTHDVNATGTLNVLLAARDNSVGRVIFSSSSSVFGSNRHLPKTEDMTGSPLSPYAATKRIGEDYCRQFGDFYGLDVVVVRFFNVFGPRQAPDHAYAAVIPKFIDAALRGDPVEIHGDGLQSRDFTYVGNAIDGLMLLSDTAKVELAGQTFHLACGQSVSLLDILDELDSLVGSPIDRNHVATRPGDIKDSLADISKLCEQTGYHPEIDAARGLEQTLAWFRES